MPGVYRKRPRTAALPARIDPQRLGLTYVDRRYRLCSRAPCYGHQEANRLEGDHFWVEWPDGVGDAVEAERVLAAAEHARAVYTEELGWAFTDEPIVLTFTATSYGTAGMALTEDCDTGPVPIITLFVSEEKGVPDDALVAHEVVHAAEYAYTGSYQAGLQNWLRWMEGTASYLSVDASDDWDGWASDAHGYLNHPWLSLHHNASAFLVPEWSDHMYGTSLLAQVIDENFGGPDIIRGTWEYASAQEGTIFFPDAIDAVGLDFADVRARFMAVAATGDLAEGSRLPRQLRGSVAFDLPAKGEPSEVRRPEGLGLSSVHFPAALGRRNRALEITFDGSPEAPWHVALVRSSSGAPGAVLYDYVPLQSDADGHAEGWIQDFGSAQEAWLVASPHSDTTTGLPFSWTARLIDQPESPMLERVVVL